MAARNTSSPWTAVNFSPSQLPSSAQLETYTVSTPPRTDIWRPDSETDVFTAPILHQTVPSATFRRATLTVSADWKTQYDQGGMILFWPSATANTRRWIKAGIEYFNGVPYVGVVGCDRFADWSLSPVPRSSTDVKESGATLTLEATREGTTLWIYALGPNGERIQALREVKWAFLEERADSDLFVGLYAAKPTPDKDDETAELKVQFQTINIETE